MAQVVVPLSEFGQLSPGSHIHIVTDQFNLETKFPYDLEIQTPCTFYKITNNLNLSRQSEYEPLPSIPPHRIRASSILNMLVIFVLSSPPEIFDKTSNLSTVHVKKLSHAVNSGRSLLVPSTILGNKFQGQRYFKSPFAIFWFTDRIPRDGNQFPTKSFFTRQVSTREIQPIYTTLFIVTIQRRSNESKIVLVRNHCSRDNGVQFITAGYITNFVPRLLWISRIKEATHVRSGFHERLDKLVQHLAPVSYVTAYHDEIFKAYVSYGCESRFTARNIKIIDISELVLCERNITIYHLTFRGMFVTEREETTQPIIYDERYLRIGYVNCISYKVSCYLDNSSRKENTSLMHPEYNIIV